MYGPPEAYRHRRTTHDEREDSSLPEFEIVGPTTVRDVEGREHDVLEAVAALPWVSQLCPLMPHDYAHKSSQIRSHTASSSGC